DQARAETLVLEEALEQAEDHERARVADVYAPIHRGSARVDADRGAVAPEHLEQLARARVVQAHRAHLARVPETRDGERGNPLAAADEAHALTRARLHVDLGGFEAQRARQALANPRAVRAQLGLL